MAFLFKYTLQSKEATGEHPANQNQMECVFWEGVANSFQEDTEVKDQQNLQREMTEYFRMRAKQRRGGRELSNQGGRHTMGNASEA